MKSPPHCQHDAAFHSLEEKRETYQANLRLKAIEKLLYSREDFSESELRPILEKRDYPLQVKRGLELYMMMANLMKLCEPRGNTIGPTCTVQQVKFEDLTLDGALELRNGIGLRVVFQLRSSSDVKGAIVGLNMLTSEERDLYERIKPYFAGRQKPTLKVLAARLLRDSEDRLFSERSILRYIEILSGYRFPEQNYRRDYLIRSVNRFGAHNKSTKESFQYVMAQTVIQFGQVIRQQMIQSISESIQLTTQILPIVVQRLPELQQETFKLLARTIPQTFAQVPVVFPQIQLAFAELHRSLPQTLAQLYPNIRQN